ncbi:hypothetical protein Btru_043710 [Bulinus truncatus]|nr:hypothetical protein Btru_043710 [Bulinus truncatus]
MLEQDLNPAATKFISSLVRSLQILCNGQVEFNETIELVGHINVKIDHKFKFDYIVDEHVSKEGEDSSTTFLSNSYHSCRPAKQSNKKQNTSELEQDVIFSEIPKNTQKREKMEKNLHKIVEKSDCGILGRESNTQNYSVSIEPLDRQFNEPNQMVVKLLGGDDSNDCMVLPASPGEYEGEENRTESYPVPGPSSSFDDSLGNQTVHTRKKRKFNNQGKDTELRAKVFWNLQKKTSAAFSCKEYLARYNVYCQMKSQQPDRSEMLKIFSDLAQKYGVAITIKPVKSIPQSALSGRFISDLACVRDISSALTEPLQHGNIRQQPLPKRQRGINLIKSNQDPVNYEQYGNLPNEEQARDHRCISKAQQDPDVQEKKSLMNRVVYLRKVGKLPSSLEGKCNNVIRQMHTADLKAILPPVKTLKNMDPAARDEWYRLGRSREWRRKRKLVDPEGFKKYNNERAKKYQENLRANNPEKLKALRAKAAEKLRQYRCNKQFLKVVQATNFTDSLKKAVEPEKKAEVLEFESELDVKEEKIPYIIHECASTHGEAATKLESTSASIEQPIHPDILDLIYN